MSAPIWHMSLAGSELMSARLGEALELRFSVAWVRPVPAPRGQGEQGAHLSGVRWVLSGVTQLDASELQAAFGRLREGSQVQAQGRLLGDVPLPSDWDGPLSLTLVLPHGEVLEARASGLRCLVDGHGGVGDSLTPRPSLAC